MKRIKIVIVGYIFVIGLSSCRHEATYPNIQSKFAYDQNFRLGKWYSITDSGTTSQTHNTSLDTIWFVNDTLAGWTQFANANPYVFLKTYIDTKSVYNLVIVGPDRVTIGKMDTSLYQFGFSGDTLTFYWNFTTNPPQVERYLKMK